MRKWLKFIHYLGLIMFLGSILLFTLISMSTEGSSLENLVFARRIIKSGTLFLTLPGMWLVVLSGLIMTIKYFDFFKQRWLNIKHVLIVIIVLNATFVLTPIIEEVLHLAEDSLVQGKLLAEYSSAYIKESVAGAFNVILIIVSMIAGIWRFEKK